MLGYYVQYFNIQPYCSCNIKSGIRLLEKTMRYRKKNNVKVVRNVKPVNIKVI
jgi:hypothetical protein